MKVTIMKDESYVHISYKIKQHRRAANMNMYIQSTIPVARKFTKHVIVAIETNVIAELWEQTSSDLWWADTNERW